MPRLSAPPLPPEGDTIPGLYAAILAYHEREAVRWQELPKDAIRDFLRLREAPRHAELAAAMRVGKAVQVPAWVVSGYEAFAAAGRAVSWLHGHRGNLRVHRNDRIEAVEAAPGAAFYDHQMHRAPWELMGHRALARQR